MSTEYGLFNDEGIVEGGFYSKAEAQKARADRYDPEDELDVFEVCPEHNDYPRICCDACDQEEDDDELMEAEHDDQLGAD